MGNTKKSGSGTGPGESSTGDKYEGEDKMKTLLGFSFNDCCSWSAFVKLLSRPTDPASLGVVRFLFGLLMFLDAFHERGLSHADYKWGDPEECRFPLFSFLKPLPLQWMYIAYMIMMIGTVGIMLGLFFNLSCFMFTLPYWYLFCLDKTVWNNHSYLYGLCSLMLLFSQANRYFSLDGLIWPKIRNSHVPLYNYTMLRTQFFLVYFLAGLKKLDMDWVAGYSMHKLSHHWVFKPFTYMMTNNQIDLWVVHRGGLFIDLFMGYFLFFDKTRLLGLLIVCSFHGMNSQIFSIGMFPYMMLATTPLFCGVDWPKRLLKYLPAGICRLLPSHEVAQNSEECLYPKEMVKPEQKEKQPRAESDSTEPPKTLREKPTKKHHFATIATVLYILLQMFLPYSHFITKGYNNWTNGLYGYSWDMMVHSWSTQHLRITYVNKDTNEVGYLNPEAWTRGRLRWSSHADMVKQYATCIQERLVEFNITNIELYFDVWRSLNDRFQQRMYDPNVNILEADWHPLIEPTFLKPLLTDLSDWRERLDEIEKGIYNNTKHYDVAFIADFPGLSLENFIQKDLGNTTIQILKGDVVVELIDRGNEKVNLTEGDSYKVPAGEYHTVHTVSDTPSCYMYHFVNTSEVKLFKNISEFERKKAAFEEYVNKINQSDSEDGLPAAVPTDDEIMVDPDVEDPALALVYQKIKEKRIMVEKKANMTTWEKFEKFLKNKYQNFVRGLSMTRIAIISIVTGDEFEAVFNSTIGPEPPIQNSEEDFTP